MRIGPTFSQELSQAGLAGLPFVWDSENIEFDQSMTQQQIDSVNAVLSAHDPTKQLQVPALSAPIDQLKADFQALLSDPASVAKLKEVLA